MHNFYKLPNCNRLRRADKYNYENWLIKQYVHDNYTFFKQYQYLKHGPLIAGLFSDDRNKLKIYLRWGSDQECEIIETLWFPQHNYSIFFQEDTNLYGDNESHCDIQNASFLTFHQMNDECYYDHCPIHGSEEILLQKYKEMIGYSKWE